jgi:prepilin-type N-terminal cleavage/methylation domain-containing protein
VNNAAKAFTMIEMMVVIVIIGIMAAIMIPRFTQKSPRAEWPMIVDDLNNLVFFARQEAIANQKNYRLAFTNTQNHALMVVVEEEKQNPEKPEQIIYEPAFSYYFTPQYIFHESVSLKAFFVNKTKKIEEGEKGKEYCYVIPDGLVQDITLQLFHKNSPDEKGVTLKMMPFYGIFTIEEGFTRPG